MQLQMPLTTENACCLYEASLHLPLPLSLDLSVSLPEVINRDNPESVNRGRDRGGKSTSATVRSFPPMIHAQGRRRLHGIRCHGSGGLYDLRCSRRVVGIAAVSLRCQALIWIQCRWINRRALSFKSSLLRF